MLARTESQLRALQDLIAPQLREAEPDPEGGERSARPRKQAPRMKPHRYNIIGEQERRNTIAEKARARAAASTQPR